MNKIKIKQNTLHFLLIAIMLWMATTAWAQSGPISPCEDCETLQQRTVPVNGMWYNPQQSGTGFGIDIQNGKIFGAYYGYDSDGKQVWLTFGGTLEPSNETNVMWEAEIALTQFEGGNEFNSNYQVPQSTDYQGLINIKFTQKNHALYSVNGGEQQNIVPIIFGNDSSADFPEHTSYEFPNLEGMWVFVYEFNGETESTDPAQIWNFIPDTLYINPKNIENVDGQIRVKYFMFKWDFPESYNTGAIRCIANKKNTEMSEPNCTYHDNRLRPQGGGPLGYEFKLSIGGIGSYRLFGQTQEGHTFEAIRLNSKDYFQ